MAEDACDGQTLHCRSQNLNWRRARSYHSGSNTDSLGSTVIDFTD
jgi:hypothetical protein